MSSAEHALTLLVAELPFQAKRQLARDLLPGNVNTSEDPRVVGAPNANKTCCCQIGSRSPPISRLAACFS